VYKSGRPESMADDCSSARFERETTTRRAAPASSLQWTLGKGRLNPLGTVITGRLSLATLAGTVWVLRAWDLIDPAESEPVVTLAYESGRFTGTSGCNRYSGGVEAGDLPGVVKVGLLAGTRMACPEPQSSVEGRFLGQLGGARTIGFRLGRLAIGYARADGSQGTMVFEARP
jgi:heat shock protein HslJ